MTFKGPVDTVLSVGGRNLTGMGMLMNIQEQPFTAKTEEIDLVGAPYIYSTKTGKKGYRFSVAGYVRDDAGSVLRLSNAAATGREPHSAIYARFGDAPGAHADLLPAVIASGGDFDLPRDGLVKVNNLQYQLAAGAGVLMDGTLIGNRVGISTSSCPLLQSPLRLRRRTHRLVDAHRPRQQHRIRRGQPPPSAAIHHQRGERLQRMGRGGWGQRSPVPRDQRSDPGLRRDGHRQPGPLGRHRV